MDVLLQWRKIADDADKASDSSAGECLTPWDVQSRRIFDENGIWPALYSGDGGGHGYVSTAFACNQRDEVRDLNDIAAAVQAQPGMKQQTFVTIPINTQIATRHESLGEGTGLGIGDDGEPAFTLLSQHSHAVFSTEQNCLNAWAPQQSRIFTENGVSPTLAGCDGGGGRNPGGLVFASAFSPKPSANARSIGYEKECSPTLTSNTPAVICLLDQGGQRMDVYDNQSGTLRAQMTGHPPLVMATQQGGAEICEDLCPTITSAAGSSGNNGPIALLFENYGVDSRYTGPHPVSPTISARAGTGGGNLPLVTGPVPGAFSLDSAESNVHETYAIAGNIVGRKDENGGNGLGCQPDISYTLTSCDQHCVFAQQGHINYSESPVASTQTARQHKDATDLVCGPYQETVGALVSSDYKGINNQYVSQDKCITERLNLVRRLTPLECERLQGFPDHWTDIPGASDSARYKSLGNSVAIPCVEYIMMGIAAVYAEESEVI